MKVISIAAAHPVERDGEKRAAVEGWFPVAATDHAFDGQRVEVTRPNLRRWLRAWRAASKVSERTIQRHFARLGLDVRPDGQPPRALGRFEADELGELWTGDGMHGPEVDGAKAILFAFIDDWSRAVPGCRPPVRLSPPSARLSLAAAAPASHAPRRAPARAWPASPGRQRSLGGAMPGLRSAPRRRCLRAQQSRAPETP